MTIQDLGSIGKLVAAIATVVTLIYLAIQIRANTSAVRSESRGRIATHTQGYASLIGGSREVASVFLRGLSDLNSLDIEEQTQFVFLLSMLVNQANENHHEYVLGLGDSEQLMANSRSVIRLLRSSGGREYWRRHHADYAHQFQEFVNGELSSESKSS